MISKLLPNHFAQSPATYLLIIIVIFTSIIGFLCPKLVGAALLHPWGIFKKKQYHRLFTADLVHVDAPHLLLNIITMYVFCSDLEEILLKRSPWGSWNFLIIYCGSMITANLLSTIRHRSDYEYSSAGASGSIIGCLFSFMILDPGGTALNVAIVGSIQNMYLVPLYAVILLFYKLNRKNEFINHDLHFFGAVGGIITTLILFPGILTK